jgi:hypothetical protein
MTVFANSVRRSGCATVYRPPSLRDIMVRPELSTLTAPNFNAPKEKQRAIGRRFLTPSHSASIAR